jgi:hypothetical protein
MRSAGTASKSSGSPAGWSGDSGVSVVVGADDSAGLSISEMTLDAMSAVDDTDEDDDDDEESEVDPELISDIEPL